MLQTILLIVLGVLVVSGTIVMTTSLSDLIDEIELHRKEIEADDEKIKRLIRDMADEIIFEIWEGKDGRQE